MTGIDRKYLPAERWVAWAAFFILLATYWSTVPPTVSFWDCPEYVSAAYLLEIGHPPGNPTWMLVERIVTLLVPGRYAALAINLSSGLFTAFAGFFLAKTIFRVGLWVLLKLPHRGIPAPLAAAGGALVGALAFGWCDSAWFSAVEAEVYAMSIFMSALCIWLMAKWAGTTNRRDSWHLLVLIAYLFGLSIGIHQLNLLCIPALAMVWAVRRNIRSVSRLAFIFLLSLVAVACVLMGMMPTTIEFAAKFELLAVNYLRLPALSGVAAYVVLLGLSLLLALFTIQRSQNRVLMAQACYPAILLSGIFTVSGHTIIGVIISAVVAILLVSGTNFQARRLYLAMWMLAMLLTGYSSYAIIPIRGSIPSPANAAMPGEPFAFAAYQAREQYGAKPLLYGATPYSKSMIREDFDTVGKPIYKYYQFDYGHAYMAPKEDGARFKHVGSELTQADSISNARLLAQAGDAYVMRGRKPEPVKTPELNMWFPRITGSTPYDLASYSDWIGMTPETMVKVEISEAIDSTGKPVGKLDATGKRVKGKSYRPTYLQNAEWFATYQTGYMYWRYLLWNFSGRQNDRPSQGEVQHGNFITGFTPVDNAMLGAEDSLPPAAGSENPGRNRYFLLPFVLGIAGMLWLLKSRRRGMQVCAVTAVLFIMTGLAIVVYLNQCAGEPRERDYSFLGSYWAFCVWIGFGAIMVARRFRSVWGFSIPLLIVAWMGFENYDDHDRSNRTAARQTAINFLNTLEPNAIIFVNGDNYTFPLWYAQEVEGVRRDVRVINLAYLSQPVYAANLMADWRESKRVPTTLTRGDIIYDAFRRVRIGTSPDTLDAVEALQAMRLSDEPAFPCRYVRLRVAKDSVITYDLNQLRDGLSVADFGRLMTFDILANSMSPGKERPVYWIGALDSGRRIGLVDIFTPWIFGQKFGVTSPEREDSMLVAQAEKVIPANPVGRKVYMDHAPEIMVASQRGAIVATAKRLLRKGHVTEAMRIANKADLIFDHSQGTYLNIMICDTSFNTRTELGLLLMEIADSINPVNDYDRARITELRARGAYHLRRNQRTKQEWNVYRRNLPHRLRNKMAPV